MGCSDREEPIKSKLELFLERFNYTKFLPSQFSFIHIYLLLQQKAKSELFVKTVSKHIESIAQFSETKLAKVLASKSPIKKWKQLFQSFLLNENCKSLQYLSDLINIYQNINQNHFYILVKTGFAQISNFLPSLLLLSIDQNNKILQYILRFDIREHYKILYKINPFLPLEIWKLIASFCSDNEIYGFVFKDSKWIFSSMGSKNDIPQWFYCTKKIEKCIDINCISCTSISCLTNNSITN